MFAVTSNNVESLRWGLKDIFARQSRVQMTEREHSPGNALRTAVGSSRKGVVLIVDEYDKPVPDNLEGNIEHLESIRYKTSMPYSALSCSLDSSKRVRCLSSHR
jgi:hypothetical protein